MLLSSTDILLAFEKTQPKSDSPPFTYQLIELPSEGQGNSTVSIALSPLLGTVRYILSPFLSMKKVSSIHSRYCSCLTFPELWAHPTTGNKNRTVSFWKCKKRLTFCIHDDILFIDISGFAFFQKFCTPSPDGLIGRPQDVWAISIVTSVFNRIYPVRNREERLCPFTGAYRSTAPHLYDLPRCWPGQSV